MQHVLIVEDDEDFREALNHLLSDKYYLTFADNGLDGLKKATGEQTPDLVVIDGNLPVMDGYDLCKLLRENPKTRNVPLLILTGDENRNELKGLEMGADDFIEKPVSREIIIARIDTKLQRFKELKGSQPQHLCGDVSLDPSTMRVTHGGEVIELTALEFKLLKYLFENQGKIISRNSILESVWGDEADVNDRTIDVHFANLRKKLANFPINIKSKYGAGYILICNNDTD
ncbi:MAG: response regulator transcription factor [Oligoflexia bacterium]|nr:response regulator transcription factor [Oligoflexia bacterium]